MKPFYFKRSDSYYLDYIVGVLDEIGYDTGGYSSQKCEDHIFFCVDSQRVFLRYEKPNISQYHVLEGRGEFFEYARKYMEWLDLKNRSVIYNQLWLALEKGTYIFDHRYNRVTGTLVVEGIEYYYSKSDSGDLYLNTFMTDTFAYDSISWAEYLKKNNLKLGDNQLVEDDSENIKQQLEATNKIIVNIQSDVAKYREILAEKEEELYGYLQTRKGLVDKLEK